MLMKKCVLLLTVFQLATQPSFSQSRPKIIFDTDMGPDYDDVGALAMLHAMADAGECSILATIASNQSSYIAPVLNVLNTYFGRPSIPVGIVGGLAVNESAKEKWDSLIVARYPHVVKTNAGATDAVTLYRELLAGQPDSSVTIVTVGFLTNLSNLLSSGADQLSPLNGKELVGRKVKQLVSMAGRFDSEMGKFKEFNVVRDSKASVNTFNNWPTPILFSGFEIGLPIHTGLAIVNNPRITGSPVKDVFEKCINMNASDKRGRNSWDETAVLVAVRGYEPYFNIVTGKFIARDNGSNDWDPAGTRDAYLQLKEPVARMEDLLNTLIMHSPKKGRP